jgi:hypothetical protein
MTTMTIIPTATVNSNGNDNNDDTSGYNDNSKDRNGSSNDRRDRNSNSKNESNMKSKSSKERISSPLAKFDVSSNAIQNRVCALPHTCPEAKSPMRSTCFAALEGHAEKQYHKHDL